MGKVNHPAASEADEPRRLRVAIVEREDADPLATVFAATNHITLLSVTTVTDALALVETQQADAVLLVPELPEGWAATVADRLAAGVDARVPLLIVCRSARHARVIGVRLNGPYVRVVQRNELTAQMALNFFNDPRR